MDSRIWRKVLPGTGVTMRLECGHELVQARRRTRIICRDCEREVDTYLDSIDRHGGRGGYDLIIATGIRKAREKVALARGLPVDPPDL